MGSVGTTKSEFKDGDTPKVIDVNAYYRVEKYTSNGKPDSDYGSMIGSDVKDILKGFHYEELFDGEGMWYKSRAAYGYYVERVK